MGIELFLKRARRELDAAMDARKQAFPRQAIPATIIKK